MYPKDQESTEYKLQCPFDKEDVLWRTQSCGESSSGKPWVMALAYIDSRAIQNRLDSVFGWNNWHTEYRSNQSGILCRLTVTYEGQTIYKEDGSPETDIEAFKGGISNAFKRVAASGYGIGRYLYSLETEFAECSYTKGTHQNKQRSKSGKFIYWSNPKLPKWATQIPKEKPKKKPKENVIVQDFLKGAELISGPGLALDSQIHEINALRIDLGYSPNQMKKYMKELTGKAKSSLLTQKDADVLLKSLSAIVG